MPERRHVTDAERATFAADGVVCLRAALDPAAVAAMSEPVEPALASRAMADLSGLGGDATAGGKFVMAVHHDDHGRAFDPDHRPLPPRTTKNGESLVN